MRCRISRLVPLGREHQDKDEHDKEEDEDPGEEVQGVLGKVDDNTRTRGLRIAGSIGSQTD